MRKPLIDSQVFKQRRDLLAKSMEKNSALVVPAHPELIRNNDVHHPYRQSTNMFYLTGFEEAESVLVFVPDSDKPATLFVRKKDPLKETWDGFLYGVDGAKEAFQVDQTFPIDDLEAELPKLLAERSLLYFSQNHDPDFDQTMNGILKRVRALRGRSGEGNLPIHDSYPLIGEQRLIKSEFEQGELRKACIISSEAHIEVIKATRPGINERALHGLFIKEIMQRGAAREGYGTIVATGNNAVTLHYVFNDCDLQDGDVLLIDAGAEYHYYTGDITRSYPVNGEFTGAQRDLYQAVLQVQKDIIEMIQPGVKFNELQDQTYEKLLDALLQLKILKGDREALLKENAQRKYYPHGVSHYLGSDVHDSGTRKVNGEFRPLLFLT